MIIRTSFFVAVFCVACAFMAVGQVPEGYKAVCIPTNATLESLIRQSVTSADIIGAGGILTNDAKYLSALTTNFAPPSAAYTGYE